MTPDLPVETRAALTRGAQDVLSLRYLRGFARCGWPHIPDEQARPPIWNWHLDVVADAIQTCLLTPRGRLIINVPPGTAKSILTSALAPSWLWLHAPHKRLLTVSHDDKAVARDSFRQKLLIESEWYRSLQSSLCKTAFQIGTVPGVDGREHYTNGMGGYRIAQGIYKGATGLRADVLIIDDPYDAVSDLRGRESSIRAKMDKAVDAYDSSLERRLEPDGCVILIMQRLHARDMAAQLMERIAERWQIVCLPALYEANHEHVCPRDPRKEGENLFEARLPYAMIEEAKKKPGAAKIFLGQLQQRPPVEQGRIFKKEWTLQRYNVEPLRLGVTMEEIAITIDTNIKDRVVSKDEPDNCSIQVWGRKGTAKYLLDRVARPMGLTETIEQVIAMARKWPKAHVKLVEDKANGTHVLQLLKDTIPGLIAFSPGKDSKEERAEIAAIAWEAGEVWLPTPQVAPWIGDFLDEIVFFPTWKTDDDVDAMSQLFIRWTSDGVKENALERLKNQFGFLKNVKRT